MIIRKKSTAQRLSGQYAINRQDADLVLSTLRHQRDLFSGGSSLGVNTRVGSVVHAFENLAFQRQLKEGNAEKPYESSKSSSNADKKDSIYKINLPTTATGSALIVRHKAKNKGKTIRQNKLSLVIMAFDSISN